MNGDMKEARDGLARLGEVESEIFTAFCEYVYTESYRVPKVTVDFEQLTQRSPSRDSIGSECPSPSMFSEGDGVPSIRAVATFKSESSKEEELRSAWPKKRKNTKKRVQERAKLEPDEDLSSIEIALTSKNHNNDPWGQFCGLKYDSLPEGSEERPLNLDRMAEIEFKPLLFHCKLYVFAQMYLIAPLERLTLRNLHAALRDFHLDFTSSDEVLEALVFTFTNTERGNGHGNELRRLLVAYTVSKMKILKRNLAFRTILDEHGELGSDIVQVLG
jgi:hypothetical protein